MAGLPNLLRRRRRADQSGFTLVELLVAMVISALVVGTASLAVSFALGQNRRSTKSVTDSNSAFRTGTRFADDVASVSPVTGVSDVIAENVTGCGNETSVLRLAGTTTSGAVLVRSYHQVTSASGAALVRRECSASTLGDATTTAAATSSVVVRGLDTSPGAVAVTCDGGAVSSTCRVVTMRVRTGTGTEFSVRGSVSAALLPTATTTPMPVRAPTTGSCTIPASATTWGATGGYAGDANATHGGDASMYTYNDTNQRRTFLKFDLTQPCVNAPDGSAPTWPTLPGGRTITSATLHLAYTGKTESTAPKSNLICWGFGVYDWGVSKDDQVLQVLDDPSTWSESTLKGSNMPGGVRSTAAYNFNVANQGSLTAHNNVAILTAVDQWYRPGSWVNNGWRISRSNVGDTCGKFNTFASRSSSNAALVPRLTITWGPP